MHLHFIPNPIDASKWQWYQVADEQSRFRWEGLVRSGEVTGSADFVALRTIVRLKNVVPEDIVVLRYHERARAVCLKADLRFAPSGYEVRGDRFLWLPLSLAQQAVTSLDRPYMTSVTRVSFLSVMDHDYDSLDTSTARAYAVPNEKKGEPCWINDIVWEPWRKEYCVYHMIQYEREVGDMMPHDGINRYGHRVQRWTVDEPVYGVYAM